MTDGDRSTGRTPFPPRRVLALGLPLMLGMGGHALFNLVDLWIVGSLGSVALAAVTVASLVNTVPMVIAQGLTDGSVAIIARAVGAGDRAKAADGTRQSVLAVLVLAVLLGVPPWLAAEPLARAFGAEGPALAPATDCLAVLSWGSGTMFLLMQVCAALRAAGFGRAPALLLLCGNGLNALLSYGLVHGAWGLPRLGVVGAPWGTFLARGAVALLGLHLLRRSTLAFPWRGGGLRRSFVASLLRLGLPVAGQWMVRIGAVLVVLAVVGRHGAVATAGYGIAGRLDTLVLFATVGWGSAAATAVGQGLGAGDPRAAARGAWLAAGLGVLLMALAGIFFALRTEWLAGLFTGHFDPAMAAQRVEVAAVATEYFRRIPWAYPALGLTVVLSMALAGAGSVKSGLLLEALVLGGIQAPLVLASGDDLGRAFDVLVVTHWILGLAYAALFLSGRWRRASASLPSPGDAG